MSPTQDARGEKAGRPSACSVGSPSAGWRRLGDRLDPQSADKRRRRRRTGCIALLLSPVFACLVALAVVHVKPQPLSGILAIATGACFLVALGRVMDSLLLPERTEDEWLEGIASWRCPTCGEPYGLQSSWTGWGFSGRDLLHVDKSGWSAEARAFPATGHVTLRCAHCGSEAGFLERNGRGVHIPPLD
jgi:hypothetical protein